MPRKKPMKFEVQRAWLAAELLAASRASVAVSSPDGRRAFILGWLQRAADLSPEHEVEIDKLIGGTPADIRAERAGVLAWKESTKP